ncbi:MULTISPECIES: hypothetical protein [Lacticaseibacillus]|jgi:hypothetical protein|uniref:Uncharacterized protein n=5 Tax=Lacticaseibacillus TaxID=2759736 RepID=A0ABY9L175_9LACO|nr:MULTISPECIES: hypothetical protein [Lacticaseibacillus]KRK11968.1 hypothetical protein FD51_GL000757 [Lacticaseibacillus zeae DSM 20178 = KCTC 3804]MDE3283333.1 hypothetical protein [Lacticaseibacillus casei]MDE3316038.1 hypothetical protein [Lacticaseibacillus zeae]QVI31495.1 hypothetical protein KG087_11320 [Lacticaseibacillus zeae]QVI37038.1 hypothetical protein KGS74_12580 [Lacticaseibacillus casei]
MNAKEALISTCVFTVFLFGVDLFLGGHFQVFRNLFTGVVFFLIVWISGYLFHKEA